MQESILMDSYPFVLLGVSFQIPSLASRQTNMTKVCRITPPKVVAFPLLVLMVAPPLTLCTEEPPCQRKILSMIAI
jgi:hypothetical protein